jgi:hypothetical protein
MVEVGVTDAPRYRGAGDVLLFLAALPLARRAQRMTDTRLPDVVAAMAEGRVFSFWFLVFSSPRPPSGQDGQRGSRSIGGGGVGVDLERVARAAGRSTSRWARWFGGLDTCLTRSLVAGSLLAGRGEVVLQVGFRPGEAEQVVDGHAWITMDGEPVGPDGQLAEERYERVMSIPFGEEGGAR